MSLILLKDFLKVTSVKDCNSSLDKKTRLDRLKFIEKPSKGLWLIYRCFMQIFKIFFNDKFNICVIVYFKFIHLIVIIT